MLKEIHQVRSFGAMIWIWLPWCCSLVWKLSQQAFSVLPSTVVRGLFLVDSRRIVPTHAITGIIDSLCHLKIKNLTRRIEPMTPALVLLCVLFSHYAVISTSAPGVVLIQEKYKLCGHRLWEGKPQKTRKMIKHMKRQRVGARIPDTCPPRKR